MTAAATAAAETCPEKFIPDQTPKCMRCTLRVCVMDFVYRRRWNEQQVVDTGSRQSDNWIGLSVAPRWRPNVDDV
ncbi:hypothetical protein ACI65C_005234 [Semiaphis heraclei]